jgi:OPA family glycerol-3-phosphate transporter-like MFS transporter
MAGVDNPVSTDRSQIMGLRSLLIILLLTISSILFAPVQVSAQEEVAVEAEVAPAMDAGEAQGVDGDSGSIIPEWVVDFLPILILLFVVCFVIARLPKVEGLGHTDAFRKRRVFNWLPLGLTYAFLYMGRYNIKVSQHAFGDRNLFGEAIPSACADGLEMAAGMCQPLMTNPNFATIFMVGTWVYGCSFLINGPLTDRKGGKFAILVGAGGAAFANLLMGFATWYALSSGEAGQGIRENFTMVMSVLYGINMYFQSFGAVAIVKVNAPWFHVNERGVFGAIFGILISLGIYFAFDWGYMIIESFELQYVFLIPTMLLAVFWFINLFVVKNTPGEANFIDFDCADASSGDEGPQMKAFEVFKLMLRNPVIVTIACVEFCSGFLRQAIMQWYRTFAKQTDGLLGLKGDFVYENWGLLLCCAGILGGVFAGIISDRVFQSRRGPVAGILYGVMLVGSVFLVFTYEQSYVGWTVIVMSMAVIGVHGMLSGTASMDFGGKKNVGVAVGIIDGFVYAGTGLMSLVYMFILPDDSNPAVAADPSNWIWWPVTMVPVALIGLVLAARVWNAKPKGKGSQAH